LMGKRASTHRFMPNKFVFPGGKLDRVDQQLNVPGELSDPVMARLRKSTRAAVGDRKLRGLALAAIRETYEETGLVIGRKSVAAPRSRNTIWQEYFAHDVEPPLEHMDFIARAITPHDRFIQNDPERVVDASGELNEIHWMTLPEARQLDLPSITRWIIDRVETRIRLDTSTQLRQSAPFIRFINGARVTADL
jgi:8-oxo-dGTP pyrophosphatase MutT (NUDIX family)